MRSPQAPGYFPLSLSPQAGRALPVLLTQVLASPNPPVSSPMLATGYLAEPWSPGHLVFLAYGLPPPPSPAIWVLLAAPLCPSLCVCLTHGPLPPPCTLLTFALLSLGVSLTSHTHLCHSLPLLRWSICLSVCPSLLFLFSLPVPLPPQDDSWILERQHPPPPSWPQTSPLLPTQSPRAALSFPTSCQHLSPTFC